METPQLTPYLAFNGNCREAMHFYQHCLGGELLVQEFAGTPAADYVPAEQQQQVLHACLTSGGITLMASDCGTQKIVPGNSVALSLHPCSAAQATEWFTRLSEGGTVTMPLEPSFWSALYGMLTDQFGTSWMVNYAAAEQPAAATQAAGATAIS